MAKPYDPATEPAPPAVPIEALPARPDTGDRKLARPLMIFDGDCGFCRRWIVRFQEITGDRVDYAPSQEAGADFPSIPKEDFAREVKLVEPDGRVFGAAEAVFRLLFDASRGPLPGFPLWAYRKVPGVRWMTETGYHCIAEHRMLASTATRWLWGNDVRAATFFTARTWFLRALGAVYFLAFFSLRLQVDGLIGKGGILPIAPALDGLGKAVGPAAGLWIAPTLLWLTGGSDGALHFLCNGGMVLAALLVAGVAPAACLALLWVFYLSLVTAGQDFLSFQWDALLLETGFLSISLAPLRWWSGWRVSPDPVSRVALFLMRWLLFRFMLMSGVVKLTSGDETWLGFSALKYHYETQPLPTWIGWWAHQAPDWWQTVSLGFVFVAELIAPFFVFGPRRVRLVGFVLLVLLQVLIALTGNYGFFNLLTVALCLLLLDDFQWPRRLTVRAAEPTGRRWPLVVLAPLAAVYLFFGTLLLWEAYSPLTTWQHSWVGRVYEVVARFRSLNGYGLFRVMTRERPEIIVEGSDDGQNWRAYTFRWKPGDPRRAPAFVAPYMPRLDWQMWFAALDPVNSRPWFQSFLLGLLRGAPEVAELMEENPFPDAAPRYVRALVYDYHFTNLAERRRTGAYWRREPRDVYFPPWSLEDYRAEQEYRAKHRGDVE